jgi:hypothetical protein
MAVGGRKSTEVTVAEKTRYSGLGEFQILAVNPSKSELEGLGISPNKDPEYVSVKQNTDIKIARLDFWLKEVHSSLITKISLWVEDRFFISNNGEKQMYINRYGKCVWGKIPEDNSIPKTFSSEYFLADGVRGARRGEEDLHNFLSAYLNTVYSTKNQEYDDCLLENVDNYFKNDFSELKEIVKQYSENTVRLLCGVDEKGYQVIYNKFFEKTCVKPNYKKWTEVLQESYKEFKAEYDGLEFKEFIPNTDISPTSNSEIAEIIEDSDEL